MAFRPRSRDFLKDSLTYQTPSILKLHRARAIHEELAFFYHVPIFYKGAHPEGLKNLFKNSSSIFLAIPEKFCEKYLWWYLKQTNKQIVEKIS